MIRIYQLSISNLFCLGKTLEILALVGINRRSKNQSSQLEEPAAELNQPSQTSIELLQESKQTNPYSKFNESTSRAFSCLCGQTPSQFKAAFSAGAAALDDDDADEDDEKMKEDDDIDYLIETTSRKKPAKKKAKFTVYRRRFNKQQAHGNNHEDEDDGGECEDSDDNKKRSIESPSKKQVRRNNNGNWNTHGPIYQCVKCAVHSHPRCLTYRGPRAQFMCLQCCTKYPVESGCTLIVTPQSICGQWKDEIDKHMKSSHLRVKIYQGVSIEEFSPFELATYDVCITTYEVLGNELDYVFAFENMRQLRKPKRYMNIPSPLMCVKWWRVCLDEAQMVHSTQAKCAAMANRLSAVNRW